MNVANLARLTKKTLRNAADSLAGVGISATHAGTYREKTKQKARKLNICGLLEMVEPTRLELATPTMPLWCSTN